MKDNECAISVIMPVYMVEAYVARAIESVLNQTLSDIELWAIDDGSPDRSGSICDEYARADKRLHVIHQENRGAPLARNAALGLAKGKYVYFIDSDDWIEKDMLEKMYELAEDNRADLVITGFCMEYYLQDRYRTFYTECIDYVYQSIDTFRCEAYKYLNNSLLSLPWNKLFLRENIEKFGLRFQDTKWDDHHFCMDYLMDCQKVVLSSIKKYHWYRSREGSETMINYSSPTMFEKRREHYVHVLKLYEYWGISDAASMQGVHEYYAGRIIQCVQELTANQDIAKTLRKEKIATILNDPYTVEAFKDTRGMSRKMRVLAIPIKLKSVKIWAFGSFCG